MAYGILFFCRRFAERLARAAFFGADENGVITETAFAAAFLCDAPVAVAFGFKYVAVREYTADGHL